MSPAAPFPRWKRLVAALRVLPWPFTLALSFVPLVRVFLCVLFILKSFDHRKQGWFVEMISEVRCQEVLGHWHPGGCDRPLV